MASATEQTVLAESPDGSVLGWVRFGDDPDDARNGHIYSLYVQPSAGGRGVGPAAAGARDRGAAARDATVTLWVFEANARARRLYAAAGFVPDGGRRVEPECRAQEIHLLRPAP